MHGQVNMLSSAVERLEAVESSGNVRMLCEECADGKGKASVAAARGRPAGNP